MTIKTLKDLINSEEYQIYASETVHSIQDHCINPNQYDTDVDTMEEHNENGMWGVTHNDTIQNWRDYLNNVLDLDEEITEAIEKEIDECEQWHIDNESIEDII